MSIILDEIKPEWKNVLSSEFTQDYFLNILLFLEEQKQQGKVIYPKNKNILRSLSLVDYDKVKVVIFGQDPYHGPNQANGFAFAVNSGTKAPPSLKNIFKEIASDLNCDSPTETSLEGWANQGVLMINSILTVQADTPASHKNVGWQQFTDQIIKKLNQRKSPIIFLLWGSFAQEKGELITNPNHYILKAPHPSPFSVYHGFFGCKHFSKANELLVKLNQKAIDWTRTG
jgi:uracil-DNA glycosylase